jgi:hypothetical protein
VTLPGGPKPQRLEVLSAFLLERLGGRDKAKTR